MADDCALTNPNKSAGRRGLAGSALVLKISGAMAEEGKSLEEIVDYLEKQVVKQIGTISISLSPCSVPGSGPSFTLGSDEMELGLGVHGEAGVQRIKLSSAQEAVQTMINHMTNPDSSTCFNLKEGQDVVLLLNNLGGTTNLEMNIILKEVTF